MNNTIARSILFVVPRMAEDTNTNVAQCVQQKRKRKTTYILWRVEKRTQMVGTGGSETHTLHEWAAPAGNPPAAGGRGIRRVDPRGALLPQSLSAPTFATHHVSKKKKNTHPATYDFHPPVAGMPLQFFFFALLFLFSHLSLIEYGNRAPRPSPAPIQHPVAAGCCVWMQKKGEKTSKLNIWSSCRADV